ncbi:fertilization-influencing membrane protein [Myotis daubentonii]|uniref:fertilization-influencing membrane protein n=1 Tax=Myotis daubentonii TaxID=98922 RepID=UPI00287391D2|nr:fertilization-influencing membrane protein [Myotis daubentonii]
MTRIKHLRLHSLVERRTMHRQGPRSEIDAVTGGGHKLNPSSSCTWGQALAQSQEPELSPSIATGRPCGLAGPGSASAAWGGRGSAGLLSQTSLWSAAPTPEGAKTWALGAESPRFLDRPDFFDYPDSDPARRLAVAGFIGEKPAIFVKPGSNPKLFHHILVGILVAAFFFVLFQFCTHM